MHIHIYVSQVIVELLTYKCDVNAKHSDGFNALFIACIRNSLDLVRVLVANGADVNCRDLDGGTALMLACMNDNIEMSQFLIDSGADVNLADNIGISSRRRAT